MSIEKTIVKRIGFNPSADFANYAEKTFKNMFNPGYQRISFSY